MPKKGPDKQKIEKIVDVLETSGNNGIWIRELSRQTKIPFTTVYLYLHKYLKNKVAIKDMEFGLNKTNRFKIVKLKKLSE
ncbi:MAG: hypothetical protein QMD14_05475 [Candidatus Aenigmarchaeota archaeon]|nr:hypothetical protein [Candidatus Aenigmarchaeota archaeon]